MIKKCTKYNIGVRKIMLDDGAVLFQLLFTVAIVFISIFLQMNTLQWVIILLVSLAFLFTGIFRSAAKLLITYDEDMNQVQAIRVRAMSTGLMAFTAGITFFTFLLLFMPKINQLF